MNRSSAELKDLAKKCLAHRYSGPVGAYLIISLITFSINSSISFIYNEESAASQITYYTASLIISLLESILTAGLIYYMLNFSRNKSCSMNDLTYGLRNHPDRFIVASLIMALVSTAFMIPAIILTMMMVMTPLLIVLVIPTVLAYIAGIIFSIRYVIGCSQVFFLLIDNPDAGAMESLRKSRELMRGQIGRFIYLSFSFIGWGLLGICSCGIGFLWISPYINATMCFFYMDLTGELDRKASALEDIPGLNAFDDSSRYREF